MAITPVPAEPVAPVFPPLSAKASGTYNSMAYAWGTAMPAFAAGVKALGDNVYANASAVVALAGDASAAAAAATASAASAAVSSGVAAWVSGQTYAQYAPAIDPGNFQVYRRRSAGSGTTPPRNDPTNWAVARMPVPVLPITTNTSALVNTHYVMRATLTLTLPGVHEIGDFVTLTNRSGGYGCVIAPDGSDLLLGVAGPRNFNSRAITRTLVWSGATDGWV